jgi:predicted transporter
MAQPIKTSLSTQRKLSLAAGILSAIATFVSLISKTWGFAGVGEQIVTTFLATNSVINMYFFGSTSQKITEDKKDDKNR